MIRPRHRLYAAAPLAAALFSFALLLQAAWIPLKAGLAQWLIERSWDSARDATLAQPPWPWADTRAVAVLRAPRLGIRQVVLAGASGRNLAFGPALHEADGLDLVVSGHRDTHFRFLEDLQEGDLLKWENPDGIREYEIATIEILDSRIVELVIESGVDRLTLVTCYPFDALRPGGPLRYVVTAYPSRAGTVP